MLKSIRLLRLTCLGLLLCNVQPVPAHNPITHGLEVNLVSVFEPYCNEKADLDPGSYFLYSLGMNKWSFYAGYRGMNCSSSEKLLVLTPDGWRTRKNISSSKRNEISLGTRRSLYERNSLSIYAGYFMGLGKFQTLRDETVKLDDVRFVPYNNTGFLIDLYDNYYGSYISSDLELGVRKLLNKQVYVSCSSRISFQRRRTSTDSPPNGYDWVREPQIEWGTFLTYFQLNLGCLLSKDHQLTPLGLETSRL